MPMVRYKYMVNIQTIESDIVKNSINQNDVQNTKMIQFMHSFWVAHLGLQIKCLNGGMQN